MKQRSCLLLNGNSYNFYFLEKGKYMSASFTENMAKSILLGEQSPTKFERFCGDLFSNLDKCIYVPTSWNYDQGRDGRTSELNRNEHPPVICVSLRDHVLAKAQEDADSLSKKKHKPKIIRFCVIKDDDKDATEHLLDKCKDIFLDTVDGVESVIADGILQLASLSIQYPASFEKYYLAEIENLRNALAVDAGNTEQIQITGMRIALTTQFSEDANELRDDLQKNLVLSALSKGENSLGMICKLVSDSLKLSQVVNQDYLVHSMEKLVSSDLVAKLDGKYKISPLGLEELKKRTDEGASNLINGQQLIRDLILELTGETIDPDDFTRLWRLVQDEIANMFMANGIYILQSIESIISNGSKVMDHQNLHDSIVSLSDKVGGLPIWGNKQQELKQAFIDMFHERDSQAFKWLAGLGTIYVSLCSLGLESSAQQQIEASLRNIDLLLDTDIILSFLSSGEPKHEAIGSIVNTWQRISGHIYVTPCVLEETAYHAWISQREYDEIWRDLRKYNDREALSLIANAFVRGFRAEMKGKSEYAPKY